MTLRSHLLKTGIRRSGGPRNGYRYRHADGRGISAATARRIGALRIPAAWTDVSIARAPRERVQAIGRDSAGRWQYLYGREHSARRTRVKFDRLIAFGEALPALRRTLARDLARPGLPREKAMAAALALLSTCFLRPGTEIYAAENGSFGLATLRHRHVTVEGDTIRLDFRGKHGRRHRHEVRSRRLAAILRAMKRRPGAEILKFVERTGRVRDLRSNHLNAYIKRVMGTRFSARDFRTWAGTLICAGALARAASERHMHVSSRLAVGQAIRETAARLGNTLAVSRRAYIHPGVIRAFARGVVVRHPQRRSEVLNTRHAAGLDRSERALLELLRRERAQRRLGRSR
jgi:DNA topoisomerase-1